MMVKPPPASAFVMVQPQIVLAALKILLDGPAPAAQAQRSALGGRLFEPSHIDVVGIRLALGPIRHQPASGPSSALLVQITVEANLFPGQSPRSLLAIGGLPGRRL